MLLFDLVENALFIFLWGGLFLFLFVHFTKLTGEAEYAGFFLKKETRESNMILKRQGELCANCLSCFKKDKRTKKKKTKKKEGRKLSRTCFRFKQGWIFINIFVDVNDYTKYNNDNNTDIMYCIYQLFLFIPCHLIQ